MKSSAPGPALRGVVLAALLAIVCSTTASAELIQKEASPASGTIGAAAMAWFRSGAAAMCEDDRRRLRRRCGADDIFVVNVFTDPAGERGLAFVNYVSSFLVERALVVGQFRKEGAAWSFVRKLKRISAGDQPDNVAFGADGVSFTTSAVMPGENPTMPTGLQPYVVDLRSGAVKRAPKMTRRAWDGTELVGTPYLYEGAVVLVSEEFGEIRVKQPGRRPGMALPKGTLVVHGDFGADGRIYARAHIYKAGCDDATYRVEGRKVGDTIVLQGNMPATKAGSCELDRLNEAAMKPRTLTFRRFREL